MKRFALILLIMIAVPMAAQDYEVPQISVSKDKVRVAGIAYYAHEFTANRHSIPSARFMA